MDGGGRDDFWKGRGTGGGDDGGSGGNGGYGNNNDKFRDGGKSDGRVIT